MECVRRKEGKIGAWRVIKTKREGYKEEDIKREVVRDRERGKKGNS